MYTQTCNITENIATKLDYYDNMFKLESKATLISCFKADDGRHALILDLTIIHTQGGGQPSDTGIVTVADYDVNFAVQDVRSKGGTVFHYGVIENSGREFEKELEKGNFFFLLVDESKAQIELKAAFSRAFDGCRYAKCGIGAFGTGNGYFFHDGYLITGPYVKGTAPQSKLQSKAKELELEANAMISGGGKVSVAVLPYEEASKLCDGVLPDCIPMRSTPRIVKLGNNPGCPCGGTHVSDMSEIISMKVSQIRTKKRLTKVFYTVGS